MEVILHLTGLCADNHSHLDLTDLVLGGTSVGVILLYLKVYIDTFIYMIKDFFSRNK